MVSTGTNLATQWMWHVPTGNPRRAGKGIVGAVVDAKTGDWGSRNESRLITPKAVSTN